jgi:tetratricopeptide (TPR) repeat protein
MNPRRLRRSAPGRGMALAFALALASRAAPGPTPRAVVTHVWPATEISAEARVLIGRADSDSAGPARNRDVLASGDALFTRRSARASVVLLSSGAVLNIRELSSIRFVEPARGPWFRLIEGALRFLSGRGPVLTEFEADYVIGGSLGTEYELRTEGDAVVISLYDGRLSFTNFITLPSGERAEFIRALRPGEQAIVTGSAPPVIRPILAEAEIQWWLYHPAILDTSELPLAANERELLRDSLTAYARGNIAGAISALPEQLESELNTPAARVYRAALRLAAGEPAEARTLLKGLDDPASIHGALANALNLLIAVFSGETRAPPPDPRTATEFLALSYQLQSVRQLTAATRAAREATRLNPDFGAAHARVGELLLAFDDRAGAGLALSRALELAPDNPQTHALRGFLLAANDAPRADILDAFQHAIQLDPRFANGRLGRALMTIRGGSRSDLEEGVADLRLAVALEPNRALLHAYLARALQASGQAELAMDALIRALELDPSDPAPWLCLAILLQEQNQITQALRALDRSIVRNDRRHLFRSRLLLDQDRAIRGVNLATLYRDAGLEDIAAREARQAVETDYASSAAHLFLANSYNLLRDPLQADLRFETAWFSEFLVGNLLAPVGASALSQTLSENEYSRLFDRRRPVGLASSTEYFSSGDWRQSGSVHGSVNRLDYAIETFHLRKQGDHPNGAVESATYWPKVKARVGPDDTLYLQGILHDYEAGDVRRYRDPAQANPLLKVRERHEPAAFLGHHHSWSPGQNSLVLLGAWRNTLTVDNPLHAAALLVTDQTGTILAPPAGRPTDDPQELAYESLFRGVSLDLQHIAQSRPDAALDQRTLVAGVRFQSGSFDNTARLGPGRAQFITPDGLPVVRSTPETPQSFDVPFHRLTLYAYQTWRPAVARWLSITAGLAYDRLEGPVNHRDPPLLDAVDVRDQLSPKIGLSLRPFSQTSIHMAYARSLGGISFDQSFRLEPTQVAGMNQALRSLIPESVAGAATAPEFQQARLGVDHKPGDKWILSAALAWAASDLDRAHGVFDAPLLGGDPQPGQLRDQLEYEEWTLDASVYWLPDPRWALGARYSLRDADLQSRVPAASGFAAEALSASQSALLQEFRFQARFFHPSGWFGGTDILLVTQSASSSVAPDAHDQFAQWNIEAGYRFARRRAEARLGLLNITDQDYRLDPLNLHAAYPRERTLVASLRFEF